MSVWYADPPAVVVLVLVVTFDWLRVSHFHTVLPSTL